MTMPLRVGLMLDSLTVSEWVGEVVTSILTIPDVMVSLVILPTTAVVSLRASEPLTHRLFDWYMQGEYARVSASLRHSQMRDLTGTLAEVPQLFVRPIEKRYTDIISENDVALIRGFGLDVILRFGFRIVRGSILGAARYGVWSYHHGDNSKYRGGPPGFWEIKDRDPISGVTLQVLTEELDGGLIIEKSYIRTHDTSPICNRENLYWSGVSLMRDAVRRVSATRPDKESFYRALTPSSSSYARGILRKPTMGQTICFLADQCAKFAQERLRPPSGTEQWTVGVCRGSIQNIVDAVILESSWYIPTTGHFVADPFPILRGEDLYIYLEEFEYKNNKGRISVIHYSANNGFSEVQTVLDLPYHLSYPYVFEHEGQLFMIPEAEQSGCVTLYECEQFPQVWRKRSVLLDNFPGIDPSVVYYNDYWWLFTTDGSYDNSDNHLMLFYSRHLDGPYTLHPQGRIKSSLYGSRMAGRVAMHDGRLLRPGQNCVKRYGGAVVLHQIVELTTEKFEEVMIAEIKNGVTGEFRDAFHTITQCGPYTVIDGSRRIKLS